MLQNGAIGNVVSLNKYIQRPKMTENKIEGLFVDHRGWIAEGRSIVDWEWYKDINVCHLYRHFKLFANHQSKATRGITIERGQYLTSERDLAHETGLTESQVRTALGKLKDGNYITMNQIDRKTYLYTVVHYNDVITPPRKEVITHENNQNNQDNSIGNQMPIDSNHAQNHAQNNTQDDARNHAQSSAQNHAQVTHEIAHTSRTESHSNHAHTNNIKNINNSKREREALSLSLDLENLDLKKVNPTWYDYIKNSKPGISDKQINISFGKFVSTHPDKITSPMWHSWADKEIVEVEVEKPPAWKPEDEKDGVMREVKKYLRSAKGNDIFNNWFAHVTLVERNSNDVTVAVKSKFIKQEFERLGYWDGFKAAWKAHGSEKKKNLNLIVNTGGVR